MAVPAIAPPEIDSLPLVYRGKVRDLYAVDDRHLLMVASDRLSAFDVILPTRIPGKGAVLTAISDFWFDRTRHIVPNHRQLAELTLEQAVPDAAERARHDGLADARDVPGDDDDGGCSTTSGGAPASAPALLGAVALILLARPRRRR